MAILNHIFNWYFKRSALPYWMVLALDCLIVIAAAYFAAFLEFGAMRLVQTFWNITYGVLIVLLIFVLSFKLFHTYSGILRYSSFVDLEHVAVATSLASFATLLLSAVLSRTAVKIHLPGPLFCLIIFILSTSGMWLVRILVKLTYDQLRVSSKTRKIFIYGAGPGAVSMAKGICNADKALYSLAGFISPDGELADTYMMGVKVHCLTDGIVDEMKKLGASVLAVSPLQVNNFREQETLIDELTQKGIQILMMPKSEEWDGHSELHRPQFKEVDIEDLLPRDQIQIDMSTIATRLNGKSILITGAAGSIGSEMVRQIAAFGPGQLVLVDQAETPMHDLRLWVAGQPGLKAETIVANITDASYMEQLFAAWRPEYVFHAAAYKHVPMMENNPAMAVQNNIRGTRVLADLAVKYGVSKFVMISTDKAVNPTNVMGCSKRICEIYCQSLNKAIQEGRVEGNTQFVTTRFGNVLGSNGSVIPLFREQIKNGGPLTVTSPGIIRFFMLIPEACKLVLEAGTIGNGGEIFAFDMGKPVKIDDLARRMIALSGAKGIEIQYTGLRDGEKLYEEVLSDKEKTKPTSNPKIFVAQVREYDYGEANFYEDQLLKMSYSSSPREIVWKMMEIVPEYQSTNKEYGRIQE